MTADKKRPTRGHIKITCEGAALVDWRKLKRLQGNLKVLEPEDHARLRDSILNHGISFPFQVWKESPTALWIIDAHQRLTICEDLDKEGWKVPDVPVVWIHARDRKEALRKLAAAASQNGKVTPEGLYSFMKMSKISFADVQRTYRFPEIDMTKFKNGFFPDTKEVTFKAKEGGEVTEASLGDFKHTCPACGHGFD